MGAFGDEDDISQQCDGGAETNRRPIDRHDQRQFEVDEIPDHLLGIPPQFRQALGAAESREPGEVAPGAKCLPFSGEKHRSGLTLLAEEAEEARQLKVQSVIHCVELVVRSINRRHQDLISPFDPDRFEPGFFEVHILTISP